MNCVLVVGDDDAVAEALAQTLAARGLIVERARTEIEAYRRLSSLPTIDAIVIAPNPRDAKSTQSVADFARRVIPDILVITPQADAEPCLLEADLAARYPPNRGV